jgi:hypothetical protein
MSKIKKTTSIKIGLVPVVFTWLVSTAAQAALPANCIDRLISKSEGYLKDVEGAIAEPVKNPTNHFNKVDKAWNEFQKYYTGNWANECMAVVPENKTRFNQFLGQRATPVSEKARDSLFQTCTLVSRGVIDKRKTAIETAAAEGNQSAVDAAVKYLQVDIQKNPIVSRCKPVAGEIQALLAKSGEYKAQAGSQKLKNDLDETYGRIEKVWSAAQDALKAGKEAPDFLTGEQGQNDFRRQIERCAASSTELLSQNGGGEVMIQSPKGEVPAKQVAVFCQMAQKDLGSLVAKVTAHNKKLVTEARAGWVQKNVKGGDMPAVFKENKERIPDQENLGSQIVWTYRSYTSGDLFSQCKEYTFDAGGKLLNRKTQACE